MSGALIGVNATSAPDDDLMDKNYISFEAERTWRIRGGEETESFQYPDLLLWHPPKAQVDSARALNGDPFILGLGEAEMLSEPFRNNSKNSGIWQWLKLEFGQSILCKRREIPYEVSTELIPQYVQIERTMKQQQNSKNDRVKNDLFSPSHSDVDHHRKSNNISIDTLSSEAIKSGFDHALIGRHLIDLSSRSDGIEKAIAYTSIISKAYSARQKKL